MADNIAITAGSGTTVVTDETASGHIQVVKLADGTADSTTRIPGDATNGLDVDVTRVSGNVAVVGPVAHDSDGSASVPIITAGIATTSLVANTAVANNDTEYLRTTTDGRLLTTPYGSPENYVSGAITMATDTSTQVIAAGATGVRTYITSITVFNSSASSAAIQIKDGTTVMVEAFMPAGGGFHLTFPVPLRGSAATAWNADTAGAVTTTYVTMVGYQSKV